MGVIWTALLYWAILMVSALTVCLAMDRGHAILGARSARRRPQEPREVDEARLGNPQFDVLAAHFGGPVPEALVRLYRNSDLVQDGVIDFVEPAHPEPNGDWSINRYLPADAKALEEIGWDLGGPFFPFAKDVFGNCYCVLIEGDASGPCPVYFWDHEGPTNAGEIKVADSLDEFVARARRMGPQR